jgi:hypothetical protein
VLAFVAVPAAGVVCVCRTPAVVAQHHRVPGVALGRLR